MLNLENSPCFDETDDTFVEQSLDATTVGRMITNYHEYQLRLRYGEVITPNIYMGCNYSLMPSLQRRCNQSTAEVKAWGSNHIPLITWIKLLVYALVPMLV